MKNKNIEAPGTNNHLSYVADRPMMDTMDLLLTTLGHALTHCANVANKKAADGSQRRNRAGGMRAEGGIMRQAFGDYAEFYGG